MSELSVHWLYPINEATSSQVATDDGSEPATRDAFTRLADDVPATWHLKSSYRRIQPGDRMWVYFTRPDKNVRALGRVLEVKEDPDRGWEAVLAWEQPATATLAVEPIPLSTLGRAPRTVSRADGEAADVLDAWLTEHAG